MTNEEAVKMLRTMQRTVYLGNRKFEDAIECAIKALSEPLQPWEVLAAQSVLSQPEPHWISVTEPPKGDFMPYYATCRSKVDDRENWVIEGMYIKYLGWEYPPMVRDGRAEIIAWMPKELPEPYKGVTE